jgi:hypothetical protein
MSPEEERLFNNSTPAAKALIKTAKKLQRERSRNEFKAALLKAAGAQPIPTQPATPTRPKRT